ncbi:Cyanocobalamin reductase / alkylcobalamin dealkylase [Halotydeus destructor]|nr:Cyanocobalamin reductase / alkylcobalamin dealkylase [Halotydeus destructor]
MAPDIIAELEELFSVSGYEGHPFKVGWYNDLVAETFKLKYDYDTLAICVFSLPDMFEKTFLPFVRNVLRKEETTPRDAIDECTKHYFQGIKDQIDGDMQILFDFDMDHNRKPLVIMQTAGHVSGGAYYYRNKPGTGSLGVSMHPHYGGWFAFRAVIIFPHTKMADLVHKEPLNVIPERERQEELLQGFTKNWQTFAYRDFVPVKGKYSERQIEYFATKPADRVALVKAFLKDEEETKRKEVES